VLDCEVASPRYFDYCGCRSDGCCDRIGRPGAGRSSGDVRLRLVKAKGFFLVHLNANSSSKATTHVMVTFFFVPKTSLNEAAIRDYPDRTSLYLPGNVK